jgi:hypothetical protein
LYYFLLSYGKALKQAQEISSKNNRKFPEKWQEKKDKIFFFSIAFTAGMVQLCTRQLGEFPKARFHRVHLVRRAAGLVFTGPAIFFDFCFKIGCFLQCPACTVCRCACLRLTGLVSTGPVQLKMKN